MPTENATEPTESKPNPESNPTEINPESDVVLVVKGRELAILFECMNHVVRTHGMGARPTMMLFAKLERQAAEPSETESLAGGLIEGREAQRRVARDKALREEAAKAAADKASAKAKKPGSKP